MVLKVDWHPTEFNLKDRNDVSLDVIGEAREIFIVDVGRFECGNCHS